jgi:hypothetical protein
LLAIETLLAGDEFRVLWHPAYVDVDRHDVQNKHLAVVLPGKAIAM